MIHSYDVIDLLPGELAARLNADAYFCDIPVVVAEEGNIEATIAQKQAVLTKKGLKRGVAVIVLQIVAEDDYAELALGPLTLKPSFQVVENVELNNDANGTGKSARKVARRLRDVIKTCALPGIVTDLVTDKPCIQPVPLAKELGKNLVAYQVNFKCYECEADNPETQVSAPDFGQAGGNFTLSSATATATIYYTTDGSYPSPQNPTALPYTDPVAVPADGVIVRACAYAKGMIASFVSRAEISL